MKVLGFMTGTSLDGIDMAIIDTDGEAQLEFGPWAELAMPETLYNLLQETTKAALSWKRDTAEPIIFAKARAEITQYHLNSLNQFIVDNGLNLNDIDLIGVHGQTVLHERPTHALKGRTIQLFDGQSLADQIQKRVICDFRTQDVNAGGQAAPLAPIYHQALVRRSNLQTPVVVINLGGVANITVVSDNEPIALDTGPANGLMDQVMRHHGVGSYDKGGELARRGKPDMQIVCDYMQHDYFKLPAPKSLDRYQFSVSPVLGLGINDALATLLMFSLNSITQAIELNCIEAKTVVLCGGGRHNHFLVEQLKLALPQTRFCLAEELGWRGGAIEAEAFAYLAVRSLKGLPISFPTTTGVPHPMSGGRLFSPNTSS